MCGAVLSSQHRITGDIIQPFPQDNPSIDRAKILVQRTNTTLPPEFPAAAITLGVLEYVNHPTAIDPMHQISGFLF
jgi:hypothetical protein